MVCYLGGNVRQKAASQFGMRDRLKPDPLRHKKHLVAAGKAVNEFVRNSHKARFITEK